MANTDMICMKVSGLTIDPFTNMPIIILKDAAEGVALPIWIGLIEASAIATVLEKVELARPMTHDLMKDMLERMGAQVEKVTIEDLADQTFFSEITLLFQGKQLSFDSRPSDAIALALRTQAPIYVSKAVFEKSRRIQNPSSEHDLKAQKWAEILDNLAPEDFGKYKM